MGKSNISIFMPLYDFGILLLAFTICCKLISRKLIVPKPYHTVYVIDLVVHTVWYSKLSLILKIYFVVSAALSFNIISRHRYAYTPLPPCKSAPVGAKLAPVGELESVCASWGRISNKYKKEPAKCRLFFKTSHMLEILLCRFFRWFSGCT